MRLLFRLGLFQRDDLRLGQHQAVLRALGLQRLEPLRDGLELVPLNTQRTPAGEMASPRLRSSLATRTWPKAGCSTASATTAASISGATRFFSTGLRRLISCKASSPPLSYRRVRERAPGYCGAQDTFYVGNLKGVGRVYQQTFIDTYAKVACAKLYDRKTPITAADLLNDRVIPFFDSHEVKLLRVLTDRGSEYCGNPERHEYELYLAIEDVDHTRTKTKSPQTNGICERFHKTVLNEFYRGGALRHPDRSAPRLGSRCAVDQAATVRLSLS